MTSTEKLFHGKHRFSNEGRQAQSSMNEVFSRIEAYRVINGEKAALDMLDDLLNSFLADALRMKHSLLMASNK